MLLRKLYVDKKELVTSKLLKDYCKRLPINRLIGFLNQKYKGL